MSKFCTTCGNPVNETELFCSRCGARLAPAPVTPPPAPAPVYTAPVYTPPAPAPVYTPPVAPAPVEPAPAEPAPAEPAPEFTPAPKSKTGLIIGLCGGAAALILVVVLLFVFLGGSGYEKAVDNYAKFLSGDVSRLESLAPEEYWRYEGDLSSAKLEAQSQINSLANMYGDYTCTIEIQHAEELDATALYNFKAAWVEDYYGDPDELEEGYSLTVYASLNVNGIPQQSATQSFSALKINGDWYLSYNNYLNFPAADFE